MIWATSLMFPVQTSFNKMPDDLPSPTGKNKFAEKEGKEDGQVGKGAFLSHLLPDIAPQIIELPASCCYTD